MAACEKAGKMMEIWQS